MFKRIMLALTFVAAFSAVGVGITENAEALRRWGRPYASYYYGPPRDYYYGDYVPYRAYYRARYYEPRYYDPYYGGYSTYYSYPGGYYYDPQPGVYVSFGY